MMGINLPDIIEQHQRIISGMTSQWVTTEMAMAMLAGAAACTPLSPPPPLLPAPSSTSTEPTTTALGSPVSSSSTTSSPTTSKPLPSLSVTPTTEEFKRLNDYLLEEQPKAIASLTAQNDASNGPFLIASMNDALERICGYSRHEMRIRFGAQGWKFGNSFVPLHLYDDSRSFLLSQVCAFIDI
jgi:hypothetical protein